MVDIGRPVFVAGHRGLVGSAIVRALEKKGYSNILLRTKDEVDLRDGSAVEHFFRNTRPDTVILAAAKVGGIYANASRPADFIYDNLAIQTNVIHSAWRNGVQRLIFLGSSCIYPREASQPLKEEYLLTGTLEPTNEPYAIAKIAGLKMCQAYRRQYGFRACSLMPTNLYGPNDNFDLTSSHVLPALLRKFHEAKQAGEKTVPVWGSGRPRREFLHVDDLADAVTFLLNKDDAEIEAVAPDWVVNVGTGEDIEIASLAEIIRSIVGVEEVAIRFDSTKPDGTPRKVLDVSRLHSLGWQPSIALREGIQSTYNWFRGQAIAAGVGAR